MNTAKQVDQLIAEMKSQELAQAVFIVRLANACLGWSYVFGARGEYCTPATRRRFYKDGKYPTIKSKCKAFDGGSCSGCKWYPGGQTRCYDCRGFTYWLFMQIGIKINGAGATSQWNDNNNWSEKGLIKDMPRDKVCVVFRHDNNTNKMEHTLLYDGDGHYIHDSGEVKKCDISKYSATHYAIPRGFDAGGGDQPVPTPTPEPIPEPTPAHGTAIVTGKNVALRTGPSTSANVITRIATGTTVNIDTPPDDWEYVEYKDKKGYMMKQFIKEG